MHIKNFKYFKESKEELSLEKKFEYIEDLFVFIEDMGYKVEHTRGYLSYDENGGKIKWYTEKSSKYKDQYICDKVVITPPIENKLGIETIYSNDIERYIEFQKKLIDIYEKLLSSNIRLSSFHTLNGFIIIYFRLLLSAYKEI